MKINRLGEEKINNQGYLMKIVEYHNSADIVVEFQDTYKAKIHTAYKCFVRGQVKNPHHPNVYGVGITGNKYLAKVNGKHTKEYTAWQGMLKRCFDVKYREIHQTYQSIKCCNEWLYFPNFYEWLHSQENFDKWLSGDNWGVDKDILLKDNKIYAPEFCCLIPRHVNNLFTKTNAKRGSYPVGVYFKKQMNKYCAHISNNKLKQKHLGYFNTPEEAFQAYKSAKESYIKQIAQEEYDKGNITKQCYEAMMCYQVEIDD